MTERGLPIVDGAPACPFVAFDDDRDERATSPDHRHRCFAESPPAPRALAHQEAYCLSSAFPVCPTFQDWARREAARARPGDVLLRDDDEADLPPLAADRPPRRPGQQTWAAPPPWLRGGGAAADIAAGAAAAAAGAAASAAGSGAGATPRSRGPSASPGDASAASGSSPSASPSSHAASAGATGGLAGSFADRLASQDNVAPERPAPPAGSWTDPDAWDDDVPQAGATHPAASGAAPGLAYAGAAAIAASGSGEPVRPTGEATPPRRREHERSEAGQDRDESGRERDLWAPAWERPRRLEAYPTLKSRRLPAMVLPPLLIGVVVVLVAAAALFFLPSLLGIGAGSPGAVASPSASATASTAPSQVVQPTAVPAATPTTYLVQAGDTMSKIANKFHVPLAVLIAANHDTVPNPDVLKIGDPVIIPSATPSELPAASTAP